MNEQISKADARQANEKKTNFRVLVVSLIGAVLLLGLIYLFFLS